MINKRHISYVIIAIILCSIIIILLSRKNSLYTQGYDSSQHDIKHSKRISKVAPKVNSDGSSDTHMLFAPQTDDTHSTETAQTVDSFAPSPEQIQDKVDTSMAKIGGRYQGQQEIVDAEGNTVQYSFVYAIGEKTPDLTMEEIFDGVRHAEEKRAEGQRLLAEARVANDEGKLKKAAKLLVQGDKELTKENDYVFVCIAATADLPPLISYQRGLPDWVLTQNSAVKLAQEVSGEECRVIEVRTRGIIDNIFVIETESGRSLYVDPKREKVFTEAIEIECNAKKRQRSEAEEEERNIRIQNQWEKFLSQGFDPNIFNLDDLIDLSKK
jgi:hypothetical protein